MENTIILKGSGGDLELEVVNSLQWTRCYLLTDKKLLLGADCLPYVIAGLSKSLQDSSRDPGETAGKINSTTVRYATHLEETHHSLYYGDEAGTRLLFWQSDARHPIILVGVIRLSPEQRRQWQETLSTILEPAKIPALAA